MEPDDPNKTESAVPGDRRAPIPDFHPDCRAGDMVGDYRLIRRLGAGGFGTVFLAERTRPFVKEVALKVVSAERAGDRVALARFEMERMLLAQLRHPNIAALVDGGNTVGGQRFLVMELVKGEPITRYCDERALPVRDRLAIFLQLCDAVQYAHGKQVIHRDLSPRNVLVEDDEHGNPRVKVIDFGLAKSTGPAAEAGRNVTGENYLPGTPGYASPEQFEPGAPHVDARSDIYSLGAILYELLAGAPPFDPEFLRAQGWAAIHRVLKERLPRTPSDLLSTMATSDTATADRIARARKERLDRLAGLLRADLEWIPQRALDPEQRHRYQSAESLAGDVRRYLAGEPLDAAPPSAAYRARKFMIRHRRAVVAVGAAAAALVATTVTVSVALVERTRMLAERDSALAEAESLTDQLSRLITDASIEELSTLLAKSEQAVGADHPTSIRIRGDLGALICKDHPDDLPQLERAERLLRENLDASARNPALQDSRIYDELNLLTARLLIEARRSDPVARRQIAEDARRLAGQLPERLSDPAERLKGADSIAVALARGGIADEAVAIIDDAVRTARGAGLTAGDKDMLTIQSNKARALRALGRTDSAVQVLEDAQAAAQRERPADSQSRWLVSNLLLDALRESGADPARILAQEREVGTLEAALRASEDFRPKALPDWKTVPPFPKQTAPR